MIVEAVIDDIIAKIESDDFQDSFAQEEVAYWHYLNSASFKGLSASENQLLFFIQSVIFHSCTTALKEFPEFDIDKFQQLEEINWELREKHKTWIDAKDAYFAEYSEEDLLAFVEDMLADEDAELSDIGKEVLFITSKSYVDFMTG